jgi:hypothetical protein
LATICCCFVMAFNRCGHTFRCNVGHCWMQFGSLLDVFFEYWGPLGQLWLRSWIMLEFWLPFWRHFLDIFGFWGMLFSTVFQFVSETYFPRFLPNTSAFKVPTGGSGEVFCKLSGVKEKSWKVTFCVHRTPYIGFRYGSGWRFVGNSSTPGFPEALQMEKRSPGWIFCGFGGAGWALLASF